MTTESWQVSFTSMLIQAKDLIFLVTVDFCKAQVNSGTIIIARNMCTVESLKA